MHGSGAILAAVTAASYMNRNSADFTCAAETNSSHSGFRYGLLRFSNFVTIRYDSLRFSIRFIRPSFALVFSSLLYIESESWSDETDWNRNL